MFFSRFLGILLLTFVWLLPPSASAEAMETINKCIQQGLAKLPQQKTERELRALFDRYTNEDILGSYLYHDRRVNEGWDHANPRMRKHGINLFYSRLRAVSKQSKNKLDTASTTVTAELRKKYSKFLAGKKRTIYQVVVVAKDAAGKRTVFTVHTTARCQIIDLQQGPKLSAGLNWDTLKSSYK